MVHSVSNFHKMVQTYIKQSVRKNMAHREHFVIDLYHIFEEILKGVIRCPFSTSWSDSLGSSCKVCSILWLKFLNGCVKQHPFYLLKTALFKATRFGKCLFK